MQPTREKILDTVFALVYSYGYNGTSMAMILKECQIPKGSLYHYFKSKKAMVLAVIEERLAPRMERFYDFEAQAHQHPVDTLIDAILKVAQNEQLIRHGCPLNRLNQEMSPLDKDFEVAITAIYNHIRTKMIRLLQSCEMPEDVAVEALSEFVIASVWGALSLSPDASSKQRYLDTVSHLINYLRSLKKQ